MFKTTRPTIKAWTMADAVAFHELSHDEIIGETETPLTGYLQGLPVWRSSCWGGHFSTAARKASKTNVGIHVAAIEGMYKSARPVTIGYFADSFPHVRKYGDGGWEIATVNMSANKLRAMMYWISRRGYGVTFSGLAY